MYEEHPGISTLQNAIIDVPWRRCADVPLAGELLRAISSESNQRLRMGEYLTTEVDQMPWRMLDASDTCRLLVSNAGYFLQSFEGPLRHTIWDVIVEKLGFDVGRCLSGRAITDDGEAKHYIFVPKTEFARLGVTPPRVTRIATVAVSPT
jgi:hypothetical protein